MEDVGSTAGRSPVAIDGTRAGVESGNTRASYAVDLAEVAADVDAPLRGRKSIEDGEADAHGAVRYSWRPARVGLAAVRVQCDEAVAMQSGHVEAARDVDTPASQEERVEAARIAVLRETRRARRTRLRARAARGSRARVPTRAPSTRGVDDGAHRCQSKRAIMLASEQSRSAARRLPCARSRAAVADEGDPARPHLPGDGFCAMWRVVVACAGLGAIPHRYRDRARQLAYWRRTPGTPQRTKGVAPRRGPDDARAAVGGARPSASSSARGVGRASR